MKPSSQVPKHPVGEDIIDDLWGGMPGAPKGL